MNIWHPVAHLVGLATLTAACAPRPVTVIVHSPTALPTTPGADKPTPDGTREIPTLGAIERGIADLVVTMEVRSKKGGQIHAVTPEQDVFPGDDLALNIEVERQSYLYVLHIDPAGVTTDLTSETEVPIIVPGGTRVPNVPGWWRLDKNSGVERFVVIASLTALSYSQRRDRAAPWIPQAKQSRPVPRLQKARVKVRPWRIKPGTSDALTGRFTRGGYIVCDGLLAKRGADGLAITMFAVNHRP